MVRIEENGNIKEIYEEREIEWHIDSFSSIVEDKILESPTFLFENSTWFFRFRPNDSSMPGFAAFGLHGKKPWEYSVKYDLGFKKLDDSIEQLSKGIFEGNGAKFCDIFFKLSEILEQKDDVASLNVFTIICTLKRESVHSDQQRVRNKSYLKEFFISKLRWNSKIKLEYKKS